MLVAEAESMHSIQAGLAQEVTKLEKEVGKQKLETESMIASTRKCRLYPGY